MVDGMIPEGLTFDDVLLQPGKSSVLPTQVETRTKLTRKLELNIPVLSAAMDTVTESRLAIAIARQGGLGFIHRNMPIERQAEEVDRVKRSESGMIVAPVTIEQELSVRSSPCRWARRSKRQNTFCRSTASKSCWSWTRTTTSRA
jgi:IMP dehydrogenase